jgi:hypothetical protein
MSLISKLDTSGIGYTFLINGRQKYRTTTGGILMITNLIIVIALFSGFGLDLFYRKNAKVSFNSSIIPYKNISLSSNNFIFAYRMEDYGGLVLSNDTIAYLEIYYSYYEIINGIWEVLAYKNFKPKKCSQLPNIEERERYYNISLTHWYCLDFDSEVTSMGGNWDGNFLNKLEVYMKQCTNSTDRGDCLPMDTLEQLFYNNKSSSNYFFSYMYLETLPTMDDFKEPLKSTLINKYEMVHLKLTKRNIQIFKRVEVENDKGWFFTERDTLSTLSSDKIHTDITIKDEVNQDILFTYLMYFGNRLDVYNRSYTKVQEVIANIGGFSKFFYSVLALLYSYFSVYDKNLKLVDHFEKTFNPIKTARVSNNCTLTKLNIERTMGATPSMAQTRRTSSMYMMKRSICKCVKRKSSRFTEAEEKVNVLKYSLDIYNYVKMFFEFHYLKKMLLNEEQEIGLNFLKPMAIKENHLKTDRAEESKIKFNNYVKEQEDSGYVRDINKRLFRLVEENEIN